MKYTLRGYGALAEDSSVPGLHQVTCADPAHARIFASKLLSDYQVLGRNQLISLPTARGEVPALLAPEGWVIAVVARADSSTVTVVCAASRDAATAALKLPPGAQPLPASALSHPVYLDKWDRNCFGSWHRDHNAEEVKPFTTPAGKPDREAFYQYIHDHGMGLQGADFFDCWDDVASGVGFDGLRPTLDKYAIPFQYASWLNVDSDLYNRNPALSAVLAPGFTGIHSYYGEVPHAPSLLEDQQNATWLQTLQQADADPLFNAILEPHGEIGPFSVDFYAQRSEPARQDFIRFLRNERKYDLAALSTAWFGRTDALKKWDDVTFPDQRSFYGFTPGSQMLQGEWATHGDKDRAGLAAAWAAPAFDDSAWRRLRLPGDQTVNFARGATWYRFRFDLAPNLRAAPQLYLSVISLNHGFRDKPGVVFLNGKQVGEIRMVDWYAEDEGHFEVTGALQPTGNTLALLLPDGPLPGPVFLSDQPAQDFPTSDPHLNMRKADYYDWVVYSVGAAMARSCSYLRSVDPDRAIKFHAVTSEWAERAMQAYGGFGHCTGEGAFYRPFFKHFGIPRGLQGSAEPGGSPADLRGLKNLFSTIWMEGLNAFDYFYRMPDILNDASMRAYWEQWVPYMKLMGCHNVKDPQVGILWGRRSGRFEGEWMDPTRYDWNGTVMSHHRGFAYLDEMALADGLAGQYPLVLDTGTEVWDDALSAQLEAYVRGGGTLALVSTSGRHTFLQRDAWPAARLAGCTVTGERPPGGDWAFVAQPAAFAPLAGKSWPVWGRRYNAYPLVTPGPEAQVLARFKADNAPALLRRPLGKGQVLWAVAAGGWNDDVIEQLFTEAHCPANSTGSYWTESFRSNDGCEEMLVVTGNANKDGTLDTTWQPGFTPQSVFDPVTGKPVAATITDAGIKLPADPLPALEIRFFSARRPVTAEQAFSHWLRRQSEMWQESGPAVAPPALKPFRTLDLCRNWTTTAFESQAALDAFRALPAARQDRQFQPTPLVLWKDAYLPVGADRRALYRRHVTLTPGWLRNAQQHLIMVAQWPRNGIPGGGELWINGAKVADVTNVPFQGMAIDVTAALRPGDNLLEIVAKGTADNGGFAASVMLRRTVKPRRVIDLAGEWHGQVNEDKQVPVQLPGPFQGVYAYTDVPLPADLAGQQVWIYADSADSNSTAWISTNGRVRYMSHFGSRSENGLPLEINITPDLRPGETNRFLLGTAAYAQGNWKPAKHDYRTLQLWVYDPGDWTVKD